MLDLTLTKLIYSIPLVSYAYAVIFGDEKSDCVELYLQ